MDKNQLIGLLEELHEYMEGRADADIEGGNKEMQFLAEIGDALYALGRSEYGSTARASVDPNYKAGSISLQETKNNKFDLKKYLTEHKLTKESI